MYVNMTRPVTADIRKLERGRERRKSVQRNELDAQLCGVLQSKINELQQTKENGERSLASSRAEIVDLQIQHRNLSRAHAELCSQHADLQREMAMLKTRKTQKSSRCNGKSPAATTMTAQHCAARSKPGRQDQTVAIRPEADAAPQPQADAEAQHELCMLRKQLRVCEAKQSHTTERMKALVHRQSVTSLAAQAALSALRRELRAAHEVKIEAESRAVTAAAAAASELYRAQQEIQAMRTRAQTAEAGLATRQEAHASAEMARLKAEHSAQDSAERCAQLEVKVTMATARIAQCEAAEAQAKCVADDATKRAQHADEAAMAAGESLRREQQSLAERDGTISKLREQDHKRLRELRQLEQQHKAERLKWNELKQQQEAEHASALRKVHNDHLHQLEQVRARLNEVVLQRDDAIRTAASAGREARDASQRAATEMQLLAQLEFAHNEEVKEMKQGWDRAMCAQEQLKKQLMEVHEALVTSEKHTAAKEKLLQEAQDRIITLESRYDTTIVQEQKALQVAERRARMAQQQSEAAVRSERNWRQAALKWEREARVQLSDAQENAQVFRAWELEMESVIGSIRQAENDMASELRCFACHRAPADQPVTCTPCGHNYCKDCTRAYENGCVLCTQQLTGDSSLVNHRLRSICAKFSALQQPLGQLRVGLELNTIKASGTGGSSRPRKCS